MNIKIVLKLNRELLPFQKVLDNMKEYGSQLLAQYKYPDIQGILLIESEGNPEIQIDDDLTGIIYRFCFEMIPDLLTQGKATIAHFEFVGDINLEAHDDLIMMDGDFVEAAIFPKKDFLLAVYKSGTDFIEFLSRFEPPDSFLGMIVNMDKAAKTAKASLIENGFEL